MDATERSLIMQRWNVIQHALLPKLRHDVGTLTPKLEQVKEAFEPADAVRYDRRKSPWDNERTVVERSNARLKDQFGANTLRIQGSVKVMSHLMFGILALSADQLMRLRR